MAQYLFLGVLTVMVGIYLFDIAYVAMDQQLLMLEFQLEEVTKGLKP